MSGLCVFWRGMVVHLWQTSLVLALILVFDAALRNAPSRAIHALWSIGFAKLLLPFSIFGGAADSLFRSITAGASVEGSVGISRILPSVANILDPIGRAGAPASDRALSIALSTTTVWYAAVALYLVSRVVIDCVRAGRCSGAAPDARSGRVAVGLGRALEGTSVPRERVVLCHELVMPAVVGLLRPKILLPVYLVAAMPRDELRAILLHEDAHRRRRDPLRMALWRLGGAFFFFYPPIFFVLRRLRETAEYACDEEVLHAGVSGCVYAGAIARTLNLGLVPPAHAVAAVSGKSLFRRRFHRLTAEITRRYAMSSGDRILIAAVALLVASAAFCPRPMNLRAGTTIVEVSADEKRGDAAEEYYHFDTAPKLTVFVQPVYPEEAKKLGVSATVLLAVTVGVNGEVKDAKAIEARELECGESARSDANGFRPLFEKEAIDAVRRCAFEPARLDGKPVPARVAIPFRFRLR